MPTLLRCVYTSAFLLVATAQGYAQCLEITTFPDDPILCPETDITLTATEGYDTYHWYYNFSDSNEGGTLYETGGHQITLPASEWAVVYFYVEVDDPECTTPSETVVWDGWVFLFPAISHDANTDLCPGDSAFIENAFGSPHSFQWFVDGQPIPDANLPFFYVTEPGMYTLSVTYDECPDYWISSGIGPTFTVYTTQQPTIEVDESGEVPFLFIAAGSNPQWFLDGNPIEGANELNYTPEESGEYTVVVNDQNGCQVVSEPLEWNLLSVKPAQATADLMAYPNPFAETLILEGAGRAWSAVRIFDLSGRMVFSERQARQQRHVYAMPSLPQGIYLLEVEDMDGSRSTLKLSRK